MIVMLTLVLVLLSFFVFPFFSQPTRQGHSFFFLLFFLRTTELSFFYLHFVTSVLRKWFLESVYPTKPSQF